MSRLLFALIRHGDYQQLADTPSAHQPFPLNRAGRDQARECAAGLHEFMAAEQLQLHRELDCSRLLRAWETANILSGELQDEGVEALTLNSVDDLAERSMGSVANLTQSRVEAILEADPRFPPPPSDWKSNSHYCLPLQGAESLLTAGQRVADHLVGSARSLAGEIKADTLKLIVGHGAAMRHAAYHLGVLRFEQIRELSMYHARPVMLEYVEDGHWVHVAGDWKLRATHQEALD